MEDLDLQTLAGRIAWVIAKRERPNGGGAWDEKTLSVAAKLGSSHVGQFVRGEQTNPTLSTVKKIADAAGVSAAWLAYGVGSPDQDDDARAPSTREDGTAHRGNVIGWDDAAAIVRAKHRFSDEQWSVSERVAALTTRGIISPEEVLQILRLVAQQLDPARMERQLAEAYARQRQVLADAAAREAAAEVREKAERESPPPPKPKGGARKTKAGT